MLGKLRAESWSGVSPGKGRESGEEEDGPAVRQSAGTFASDPGRVGDSSVLPVSRSASAREHRAGCTGW